MLKCSSGKYLHLSSVLKKERKKQNKCKYTRKIFLRIKYTFSFSDLYTKFYFMYTSKENLWLHFIIIIIIIMIMVLVNFSHHNQLVDFHQSLLNSPGLCSISTILWVWIVLILSLISNSSNPLSNPLGTVPSARITIGVTVICISLSFIVVWQDPSIYLLHTVALCNSKIQ